MTPTRWRFALLAGAVALAAVPVVAAVSSTALFTRTDSLTSNTVTAGSCGATTAWSNAVQSITSGTTREQWQRLGTTTATLPAESWVGTTWTNTSLVTNVPGALYCDPDAAITTNAATDRATSANRSYSSWGLATGTSTLLLWFKGTSTTAGRLASLAESNTGSSTYVERALWLNAGGTLSFGSRFGSSTANSWTVSSSGTDYRDGRWHLVAVVMPSAGGATFYVDGVQQATAASGTYRATGNGSTNAAWYLGSNGATRAPTGCPTAGYLGSYDEFVLVGVAASSTLLGTGSTSLLAAADS